MYVYLKEKYSSQIELRFLNKLNILRLDRHEIMYGLEEQEFDMEAIRKAIGLAEEFASKVTKMVK